MISFGKEIVLEKETKSLSDELTVKVSVIYTTEALFLENLCMIRNIPEKDAGDKCQYLSLKNWRSATMELKRIRYEEAK